MIIVRFGTTLLLLQMFLLNAFFGLDLSERTRALSVRPTYPSHVQGLSASSSSSDLRLTLFPCCRGSDRI